MTIVIEDFASRLLEGNPIGDPATRRVPVFLPPGYDPARRYPVAYFLGGYASKGVTILNDAAWEENRPQRLERLISTGRVRPLIGVFPDNWTRYGGAQYLDSPGNGPYASMIVREIVPWIDAKYPTISDPAHRAILGHSSGGFGAIRFAMDFPGVFGHCAFHAGDSLFEECYRPFFPKAVEGYRAFGGLDGYLAGFPHPLPRPDGWFDAVVMIANALAYSPHVEAKHGFDLPFDPETGEMREEIWTRWLAHDPVRRVAAHAAALRSLRTLWIDCGTRDEWNLHLGARALSTELRAHGVAHAVDEFDDGHMRTAYRYDLSLARIFPALPPS